MMFYLLFLIINVLLFLPLYLVNIRQQKNPLAFLTEKRFRNTNKLKLLYAKHSFSDPFHFHLEFVLLLSVFVSLGWSDGAVVWVMTGFLTLFHIEITYTAVMAYIFSRPPVFKGDWSLVKSGWILWKSNRHWLVLALLVFVSLLFAINMFVSQTLFDAIPDEPRVLWLAALWLMTGCILVPAVYHWRTYDYTAFHYRTAYSSVLHCIRNVLFGRQFNILFKQNAAFFDEKNIFKQVQLTNSPDIVHVCVESYGAIVFKKPELREKLEALFIDFEHQLNEDGFYIASNLSTAPIFTGGSWLSYSTFMYGVRFDNLQLYDGLFQYSDNFANYESIFHILNRNQYHNVLAAPLGGVNSKDVSWETISRCFQPDRILDWASYDYEGPKLRFFNQKNTFCMPDQYALNHAYEQARKSAGDRPVSLFYCTMNSHLPYDSPREPASNWRDINSPDYQLEMTDSDMSTTDKYLQAIKYQLEFTLSFIKNNSDKNILVTLFGDHQPPFVATESMGRETPVHIIGRHQAFQQILLQNGFHNGLLLPADIPPMKHESWHSMLMVALNKVYGVDKSLDFPLLNDGIDLSAGEQ